MAEISTFDIPVLVFAPFRQRRSADRESAAAIWLQRFRRCPRSSSYAVAISEDAGAAIITEEVLQNGTISALAQRISVQPPWSDFPVMVLTGGGLSTASTESAVRSRAPLGNVTLLERPSSPVTLISTVRSALLARRRQYEVREHLQQRQAAEEALRRAHDALESLVEQRTAALRRLSVKLIRVQDEERRRIARELHDSLGQDLTAAKISLDMLAQEWECESANLQRCAQAGGSLHLRYPDSVSPVCILRLLDEAGFVSAARWYVEGFGRRSGISTNLELPEHLPGCLAGRRRRCSAFCRKLSPMFIVIPGAAPWMCASPESDAKVILVREGFRHGSATRNSGSFLEDRKHRRRIGRDSGTTERTRRLSRN